MADQNKKIKIEIICVVLIVGMLITGIFFIWFLYGERTRVVRMPAFFSRRNIEVTLKTIPIKWDPLGVAFDTRMSAEEIRNAVLEWDNEAIVEIQEYSLFVSSRNFTTGKTDYYFFYRTALSEEGVNRYYAGDLSTGYVNNSITGGYGMDFLVPMHLLKYNGEITPDWFYYGGGQTHEMITGSTVEDVYHFYNNSGYYEVKQKGNQVILQKTLLETAKDPEGTDLRYEIQDPIILEVIEEGGKVFLSSLVDAKG